MITVLKSILGYEGNTDTMTKKRGMSARRARKKVKKLQQHCTTMNWTEMAFWKSVTWTNLQRLLNSYQESIEVSIRPDIRKAFRPLVATKLEDVRVVILCREPSSDIFARPDGFAYSDQGPWVGNLEKAPRGSKYFLSALMADPVSKEMKHPRHMSLRHWASQGVLLWNIVPFAAVGRPHYFQGKGFEYLSEEIIKTVYAKNKNAIFVLDDNITGKFRQIPEGAEKIIMPGVPVFSDVSMEPLKRFCVFSRINERLVSLGENPIDWTIK